MKVFGEVAFVKNRVTLGKPEEARTGWNKPEQPGTIQKQFQTERIKQGLPLCGLPMKLLNIQWLWMVNLCLK